MNTLKIIAEIKQTCGVRESEKAELMTRVKEIEDRLTGYRMAVESLEMTMPKAEPVAPSIPTVQDAQEAPKRRKTGGRTPSLIEYNGERRTIAEWSDISGVNIKTLRHRLKNGWPMKDVLSNRNFNRKKPSPSKVFAYDAHGNTVHQYMTIGAASKGLRLPESTIKAIIANMSKEDQLKSRSYYLAYAE